MLNSRQANAEMFSDCSSSRALVAHEANPVGDCLCQSDSLNRLVVGFDVRPLPTRDDHEDLVLGDSKLTTHGADAMVPVGVSGSNGNHLFLREF